MSKRSTSSLFCTMYGDDYVELTEIPELDKELSYLDKISNELRAKQAKKNKKKQDRINKENNILLLNETKKSADVAKPAISIKIVPCQCNKCKLNVEGVLISYLQLQDKSIPFVSYSCSCGHSGYRSVQARALPHEEFDKFYFS